MYNHYHLFEKVVVSLLLSAILFASCKTAKHVEKSDSVRIESTVQHSSTETTQWSKASWNMLNGQFEDFQMWMLPSPLSFADADSLASAMPFGVSCADFTSTDSLSNTPTRNPVCIYVKASKASVQNEAVSSTSSSSLANRQDSTKGSLQSVSSSEKTASSKVLSWWTFIGFLLAIAAVCSLIYLIYFYLIKK